MLTLSCQKVTIPTRNIIGGTVAVATNDVLARLPKKRSLERKIQRARRSVDALVNPGNINFPIPAEFEDMVLYDSGQVDPLRILALEDLELVHRLRFENIWFGDGTFNVVPSVR